VTYARLLKEMWGTGDQQAQLSSLRIYMRQLRRKLEIDPAQPRYLLTHPALGYRIATQHIPESSFEQRLPKILMKSLFDSLRVKSYKYVATR
jgi:hypothetical protein